MRTFLLFSALSLSIALGCSRAAEQQVSNADTWDFGRVKQGSVLKHDFILKNDSKRTLNIKDVRTSCGCTASQASKNTLSPGEEAVIEVKFNSKGYSGAVKQFVYVQTDAIDKPLIRYIIVADVVK